MRVNQTALAAIFLSALALNCSPIQHMPPPPPVQLKTSTAKCRPDHFPLQGGWLGGDVAYSIPLSNESSLWLFGDTFVAETAFATRSNAALIGNSVAISRCSTSGGAVSLKYDWRHDGAALPTFEPSTPGHRFWPQDGFEFAGSLYVTLLEVRNTPEGGPLGFEAVRSVLARVDNYLAPVSDWKITTTTLIEGKVLMGVSIILEGDYALFLTWVDRHNPIDASPAVLARVSLQNLHKPKEFLEYLSCDNTWKPGFEPQDARVIFEQGMTEMSVRFHKGRGVWVAIMHEPKFPSRHIVAQTAEHLTGPWSKRRIIYTVPEMTPGNELFDADTFCYASKEHLQFAADDALTITYACNSFRPEKQIANMHIYKPRFVTIPWSAISEAHGRPERFFQ